MAVMGDSELVRAALKKLSKRIATEQERLDTIKALEEMSDQAMVVLTVAMLEDSLKLLLTKCFRPDLSTDKMDSLFGSDRPLSSFFAKINLAHVLSLIGNNLRHDLD
jgi:hypothetical protein